MSDFNSQLGLQLVPGTATITLDTQPQHQVAPGVIHFAVLATLAEVAAARSVGEPVVPANISLSLLSPASPGHLEATGTLVKKGKRLAVAEGVVQQDETIVAKATVTFAVLR